MEFKIDIDNGSIMYGELVSLEESLDKLEEKSAGKPVTYFVYFKAPAFFDSNITFGNL